jgi:hypothetical protein
MTLIPGTLMIHKAVPLAAMQIVVVIAFIQVRLVFIGAMTRSIPSPDAVVAPSGGAYRIAVRREPTPPAGTGAPHPGR